MRGMVKSLQEKANLDAKKLEHALILKLDQSIFREEQTPGTNGFAWGIKAYRELMRVINYLHRVSWREPESPVDRAIAEILAFMTGEPKHCRDFEATKKKVLKAIAAIPDKQAKTG